MSNIWTGLAGRLLSNAAFTLINDVAGIAEQYVEMPGDICHLRTRNLSGGAAELYNSFIVDGLSANDDAADLPSPARGDQWPTLRLAAANNLFRLQITFRKDQAKMRGLCAYTKSDVACFDG